MTLAVAVFQLVFLLCRLKTYAYPGAYTATPPLLSQMSCTVQGKIDSHEMAVCSGSGVPHARWLNVPGTKVMLK